MMRKSLMGSSLSALVLCGAVYAQEPNRGVVVTQQPAANGQTNAADRQMQANVATPQHLATCIALDNQEEIILSKFAQDKAENKEVSSFAKMMVEDHQAFLKKLSKWAPDASREGYISDSSKDQTGGRSGTNANNNNAQNRSNNQAGVGTQAQGPTNGSPAGVDMMQLQREIAQQCIVDSKEKLQNKKGADFDKCYVGMQIAKHAAMHTKLTVMLRHTSADMQQLVSEAIQTTDHHLKAAESLMEKIDHSDSKNSSNKSDK